MSVSPVISGDTKDKSPDQVATNQWSDNLNLVEGRAYFLSLANKQDPKGLSKPQRHVTVPTEALVAPPQVQMLYILIVKCFTHTAN